MPDPNHNQFSYFRIAGLKDASVEAEVNLAIKGLYEQMLPYAVGEKLPPYRGIEAVIGSERAIEHSSIFVLPSFNFNNVLSVTAHVSASYSEVYFAYVETMNFDLTTGNTFNLLDYFTDDADGLKIVNDAIVGELRTRSLSSDYESWYSPTTLVAPFKGVNANQKFYLTDTGLNVVIDCKNPEFDTGFSFMTAMVPLQCPIGQVAITQRFHVKNAPIYIRDPVVKRLVCGGYNQMSLEINSFERDGASWDVWMAYPDNVPPSIIETISNLRTSWEAKTAGLQLRFVSLSITASTAGRFINIHCRLNYSNGPTGHWEESCYTYSHDGQLIALDDLFAEGFDYSKVVLKAIAEALRHSDLSGKPSPQEFFEGLEFQLTYIGINFSTRPLLQGYGGIHPLHFEIPYQEIGYENLTIFK